MDDQPDKRPKLYICATPIGNLSDMTLRAIDTLKSVDLIAAEDTRHASILLNHYQIKKPLESYKGFAEQQSAEKFIRRIKSGQTVALISDAGLPGISDPGYKLIRECINSGIEIEVIPGPSALTTALVHSGLPTDRFLFEGFLPQKKEQKRKRLSELSSIAATIIIYESPKRLLDTLQEALAIFGDRQSAVARELTKKFEEVQRGSISEIIDKLQNRQIKGEIVIIVEGLYTEEVSDSWIKEKLLTLKDLGIAKKDATKIIATLYKIKKSRVFDIAEQSV